MLSSYLCGCLDSSKNDFLFYIYIKSIFSDKVLIYFESYMFPLSFITSFCIAKEGYKYSKLLDCSSSIQLNSIIQTFESAENNWPFYTSLENVSL